jgi:hypothetical protein
MYNSITTQLSRELVNSIKSKAKKGAIAFDFPKTIPFLIDTLDDLRYSPEIELRYTIKYSNKFKMGFDIYGQADDDSIELYITLNPKYAPKIYSEIIPVIKDAVRHELEHVAQNLLPRPASEKYEYVKSTMFSDYLTARHEIPAFVRGLYKQAKTRRLPLSQIFDLFFNDYEERIGQDRIENVRQIWTDYAKRNLPKAQFV